VGREGAAAPAGLELQLGQGSVEDWRAPHGPTASRAAAGVAKGGDSKGGDGISGRKKNLLLWGCSAG